MLCQMPDCSQVSVAVGDSCENTDTTVVGSGEPAVSSFDVQSVLSFEVPFASVDASGSGGGNDGFYNIAGVDNLVGLGNTEGLDNIGDLNLLPHLKDRGYALGPDCDGTEGLLESPHLKYQEYALGPDCDGAEGLLVLPHLKY